MASFLTAYVACGILSVQMNSAGEGRSASCSVTDATAEYLPFTSFRLCFTPSKCLLDKKKLVESINPNMKLVSYFKEDDCNCNT